MSDHDNDDDDDDDDHSIDIPDEILLKINHYGDHYNYNSHTFYHSA